MTNAGSFDTWMADTHTAIELIKSVGKQIWSQKTYESPQFSYKKDGDNWIYRYNRKLESGEDYAAVTTPHAQTITQQQYTTLPASPTGIAPSPHSHTWITQQTSVGMGSAISSNHVSTPGVNSILITLDHNYKITSIIWVRKPNSDLTMLSNNADMFGRMHGGTIRASMLFLENEKILINDKVYSNETPDAFNIDIEGSNKDMRYLDLIELRIGYSQALFN